MRLKLADIPKVIIEEYKLHEIHLEQIPTLSCDPHELALVGMQNLVNEESSLQQARSLSTSEHSTDPSYIDVPREGRAPSQRAREEDVLRHPPRWQHDCCLSA